MGGASIAAPSSTGAWSAVGRGSRWTQQQPSSTDRTNINDNNSNNNRNKTENTQPPSLKLVRKPPMDEDGPRWPAAPAARSAERLRRGQVEKVPEMHTRKAPPPRLVGAADRITHTSPSRPPPRHYRPTCHPPRRARLAIVRVTPRRQRVVAVAVVAVVAARAREASLRSSRRQCRGRKEVGRAGSEEGEERAGYDDR